MSRNSGGKSQLARWVTNQRTFKKEGKLSQARKARLDELGFDWDPHDSAWETMFAELKALQGAVRRLQRSSRLGGESAIGQVGR